MTYKTRQFLGGDRRGETPVPIPNTVVKPSTADGTCLKRGRESMKLPGLNYPTACLAIAHLLKESTHSCILLIFGGYRDCEIADQTGGGIFLA